MSKVNFTINELVEKYYPIYFYRNHLDMAVRDVLGLDLSPHSRLAIRDWGRRKPINYMFCSRGMGKSVTMAAFFTIMAILYPKLKLMVIGGGGFRQSKMVLQECEKIILCQLAGQRKVNYAKYSLRDPSKAINKDPSYWQIDFKNGSVIYGVPLGVNSDGNVIRGLRAHILGVDEAFLVPSKLYQTVLNPMQNVLYEPNKPKEEQTVRNMSLKTSTCDFDFRDFFKDFKHFQAVLESGDTKSLDFQKEEISLFEFNIDDTFFLRKDGSKYMTWGLDYESIVKQKLLPSTDEAAWLAENKNIPLNIQGGYFEYRSLDQAMNTVLDEKTETFPEVLDGCAGECILGIDSAPAEANTAFSILKVGSYDKSKRDIEICKVANAGQPCPLLKANNGCMYRKFNALLYAYEANKMPLKDRVKLIYDLMDRFNIIAIALDSRGGGYELADLLRDPDFIKAEIGPEYKPIYDPEVHPDTPDGMPILKIYTITQELNASMGGYMKGLLENNRLLLPKLLRERPWNSRIFETMGHVERAISQISRIKAVPSGKSIKFIIESVDPASGRVRSANKDLFSSVLYAVGLMRDLLDKRLGEMEDDYELAEPVPFSI